MQLALFAQIVFMDQNEQKVFCLKITTKLIKFYGGDKRNNRTWTKQKLATAFNSKAVVRALELK